MYADIAPSSGLRCTAHTDTFHRPHDSTSTDVHVRSAIHLRVCAQTAVAAVFRTRTKQSLLDIQHIQHLIVAPLARHENEHLLSSTVDSHQPSTAISAYKQYQFTRHVEERYTSNAIAASYPV